MPRAIPSEPGDRDICIDTVAISLHTKEAAMQIKILALCGSSRRDSLNQKLLDIAALGVVDVGAQVSLIRWLDFPLPIYDGDWEAEHGLPECARALKVVIAKHHALLVATPQYNGGDTGL